MAPESSPAWVGRPKWGDLTEDLASLAERCPHRHDKAFVLVRPAPVRRGRALRPGRAAHRYGRQVERRARIRAGMSSSKVFKYRADIWATSKQVRA